MGREVFRRSAVGLALTLTAMLTWVDPAPTRAAPRPAAPNAVTLAGPAMARSVTIRADADPLLFTALLDQVSWLTGAGQGASPPAAELGPKFTVTVLVGDAPVHTYDLYPLASGGPRAFRPAKQPNRRPTQAGWFFGRLTMPEVLHAAGAPLGDRQRVDTGGAGAGERVATQRSPKTATGLDDLVGQFRGLLLLNVGVILLITAALASIALLVRRRTR